MKAGRSVYAVEASHVELVEALTRNGFLTMPDPDHGDITAALERVVQLWIEVEQ